ncbi:MAG: exodeoxyribonuclease V subunit gamma [Smithella sp.]
MKIIVSNKLEILARRLADELNAPLSSPFASETIVIQSTGMQKWLSLELAHYHGIYSNYDFPFPNAFIDDVFKAFIADYQPDLSYNIDVLTWKIMDILPRLMREDDFQPVHNYLGNSYDQLKLFGLASKIAAVFDQYLIFRPEKILAWEEGKISSPQEKWQALLWQKISADQGGMHKARLRQLFSRMAENKPPSQDALPERISIFGISYLPPYHLDVFDRLSKHIPVNIYYLNPSREFWADIKSGREIDLTLQKFPHNVDDFGEDLLHLESGNRLLASLGSVGRDFFRQVSSLSTEYEELFEEPQQTSLLSAIQADIYLLCDRGKDGRPRSEIEADDESIQIHSCHASLREVENLHNTLLKLLEKDSTLLCKDILVMTPNIEAYAPYIEAVFESRIPKIPYSIADRRSFTGNTVAGGFFALLDLVAGRFTAGEVLSLLENEAISEKFGITDSARELIRRWAAAVKIKWGVNEKHRMEFDLPAFPQNTWQNGFNSMLAGLALDGRRGELFNGIFPYGEIEGDKTEILGNFLDFWSALLCAKDLSAGHKTLENWCEILKRIIADFFPETGEYRDQLYKLNEVINRITREQQFAKIDTAVDLKVIKSYLSHSSAAMVLSSRYLSGSVTFCAMLPMRSIPFDVICLIGMDNEAYPRRDSKPGFDLTDLKKRLGDRSLRGEDQYLFLEAILSARKNLIISYVGQNMQDNSAILPSTLVSDLLDYIDGGFIIGDGGIAASARITRQHHLHEFHPDYFGGQEILYSYSQENYRAARALAGEQKEVQPFLVKELNELPLEEKTITVNDLINFYRHPVKYFLEKRLCLKISRDNEETEDCEPFTIDNLSAYSIKQDLLKTKIQNSDETKIYEIRKAAGALPVGAAGEYYFASLKSEMQDFAELVCTSVAGREPGKISIDVNIGDVRITGAIENIFENNLIHYRPATLKMNDYLQTWISHLLINFDPACDLSSKSILLGEDGQFLFGKIDDARKILERLIEYYRQGQKKPLKLFPRTSLEYAKVLLQKQKSSKEALRAAGKIWWGDGNGWVEGEAREIAHKICFAGYDPMDHEFENVAVEILGPIFLNLGKLEL